VTKVEYGEEGTKEGEEEGREREREREREKQAKMGIKATAHTSMRLFGLPRASKPDVESDTS
jgi:predicted transposase YdaD